MHVQSGWCSLVFNFRLNFLSLLNKWLESTVILLHAPGFGAQTFMQIFARVSKKNQLNLCRWKQTKSRWNYLQKRKDASGVFWLFSWQYLSLLNCSLLMAHIVSWSGRVEIRNDILNFKHKNDLIIIYYASSSFSYVNVPNKNANLSPAIVRKKHKQNSPSNVFRLASLFARLPFWLPFYRMTAWCVNRDTKKRRLIMCHSMRMVSCDVCFHYWLNRFNGPKRSLQAPFR